MAAVEAVELERTLKAKQTEQQVAEIANAMHAANTLPRPRQTPMRRSTA